MQPQPTPVFQHPYLDYVLFLDDPYVTTYSITFKACIVLKTKNVCISPDMPCPQATDLPSIPHAIAIKAVKTALVNLTKDGKKIQKIQADTMAALPVAMYSTPCNSIYAQLARKAGAMLDRLVQEESDFRLRWHSALKIQQAWKHTITNPTHPACIRRLQHEFDAMATTS